MGLLDAPIVANRKRQSRKLWTLALSPSSYGKKLNSDVKKKGRASTDIINTIRNWIVDPYKSRLLNSLWKFIPGLLVWTLWKERNRRIFRNSIQNHKALEVKIKCYLKECLNDIKDYSNLSQQDIAWGSCLDIQFQPAVRIIPPLKDWQIRKSEADFQD